MRNLLAPALVIGIFAASALVDAAELVPAPTFEPQLKPGDGVAIAQDGAHLMIGDQVVGTLAKGQPAVVAQLAGPWIGVHVAGADQHASGWIRLADIIPSHVPAAACNTGPQTYTAAYSPGSVQPVVALASDASTVVPSRTSDDYLIGRYNRHETDPNMHVWEPWRR